MALADLWLFVYILHPLLWCFLFAVVRSSCCARVALILAHHVTSAKKSAGAAWPHDCKMPLRTLNDAYACLRAMEKDEAEKVKVTLKP